MKKGLRHKGRSILKAKSTLHFPEFDVSNYQLSLVKQLNYYNVDVDPKVKQQWAITSWKKQGKNVSNFSLVSPAHFSQVGAIIHMKHDRGLQLHDDHVKFVDQKYNEISGIASVITSENTDQHPTKNAVSVQDRINDITSLHIGEIEGFLDDYVLSGKSVNVYDYFTQNDVKPLIVKRISSHFGAVLSDVLNDAKYEEPGYSPDVAKSLSAYLKQILSDCTKAETVGKMTTVRRSKKVSPPAKVVSKLKHMKYYESLAMVSMNPEKILDASELWLYDTSNRRLNKYAALEGSLLTVKGTTITNWDPAKSGSKIMRKPDVQLKGSINFGKRALNKLYNETRATVGKVTGRTNDKQIILKTF